MFTPYYLVICYIVFASVARQSEYWVHPYLCESYHNNKLSNNSMKNTEKHFVISIIIK